MELVMEIPRYRALSRNKTITSHWRNYQRHRNSVLELLLPYKNKKKFTKPVLVKITAHYKGKRHVDTSNLDDKIYVDAIMHSGIIEDDTAYENPQIIKKVIPEAGKDMVKIVVTDDVDTKS